MRINIPARVSGASAVLLLLAAFGVAASGEPAVAAAPLPVRKVVLYKHGMGYLERRGKVTGDATVSFSFRADQMKDLLTSFYAVDLGGGTITSVRYDTAEPLARRLQEILIKIPESAALSQFLPQLKGARVSARVSGEEFAGRVLGLEPFTESSDGKVVRQGHRLVILTDAGALRSADLAGIAELSILDEGLRADVVRLLDLALEGRRADAKHLVVTAAGTGERELRVGYLVEMPVWKCSYRLILDPDNKEKALLQGWAQAENTSGEDWENVAVSFVAGNPLSFSMDMYTPLFVPRPQVPVPGLQSLAVNWGAAPAPETAAEPQVYRQRAEKSLEAKMSRPMAPAPAMAAGFAAQRMDAQMSADAAEETQLAALLETSGGAAAQGVKVGELFSYEARDPVGIPRGQAALVPIVSKRIAGKRVLVYQASFSPRPVNAWVLANDTDLTFEAGAVTFFEGSTSLGEGILGHTLPPGGQEVVPYAVDASVDVTPKIASRQEPYSRGKVADGVLQLTRVEVLASTWTIVNRGREKATLWLHQPVNPLYKLAKPEKPLKEVGGNYRFEIVLAPGETREFAVEERREVGEAVYLANEDETRLRFFAAGPYLSAKTHDFLAEVGDLMAQKSAQHRIINEGQEQMRRLAEEEERLRRNIGSVSYNQPKEAELRAKWMAALSAAEDRLTEIRRRVDEAGAKVRALEEKVAAKLRDYREE
ncbi:MAG: DUF4139 domain-containing protein [Candidatus Methylomirabilia bacterium]